MPSLLLTIVFGCVPAPPEAPSAPPETVSLSAHQALVDRVAALEAKVQELERRVEQAEAPHDVPPQPIRVGAGPCSIQLTAVGERKIDVIKAVRQATGAGLREAKELVDAAPTTIITGLEQSSARAIGLSLQDAGARSGSICGTG